MTARQVLITIDSLLPGGAERMAATLAAGLDRSRYEPTVLVTRSSGPLQSILDEAGIPVEVLGRTRRLDIAAMRRAVAIARRADLIHSHKFANNVLSALVAARARRPLVVHEHNWSGDGSRLRPLLDRQLLGRRAEAYVCCGHAVAETVRAHGVPTSRIQVVPNAIEPGIPHPRAGARRMLGIPEDRVVLGMLTRLRPEKGVDVLLEALAMLPAPRPLACILGDGPERAAIEQRIAALGLSGDVLLAGHRDDAPRLAAAFDVGVVPSRWEGLPLAALEVMHADRPLVASAVGELPRLLEPGRGIVVPAGDPAALAAALGRLAGDPQLRHQLGQAAGEHVRREHLLPAVSERIQETYDQVLGAAGPQRRERAA